MQGHDDRNAERRQFRTIATDMANRYLPLVPALRSRGQTPLSRLIPTEPPRLTHAKLRDLAASVDRVQRTLEIPKARREHFEKLLSTHLSGTTSGNNDPEVAMAKIGIAPSGQRVCK